MKLKTPPKTSHFTSQHSHCRQLLPTDDNCAATEAAEPSSNGEETRPPVQGIDNVDVGCCSWFTKCQITGFCKVWPFLAGLLTHNVVEGFILGATLARRMLHHSSLWNCVIIAGCKAVTSILEGFGASCTMNLLYPRGVYNYPSKSVAVVGFIEAVIMLGGAWFAISAASLPPTCKQEFV